MAKNKNLIKNTLYNFKLRSRPSFFIGTYIILGSLLIKTVISGFTTDASPFGFLTVNYLESFIFICTLLVIIFSLLAFFFGNRKHERKIGNKIWNRNSKKMMWLLLCLLTILYLFEFYLLRIGQEAFIIPTFIIGYGLLLLALNFSKKTSLYQFSIACFLIGFIPLFIDGFGFYSLITLGISHYTYAYLTKV
jgi:hypothetical protein